jgi:thiosulfate reductase cytochrome b subunit
MYWALSSRDIDLVPSSGNHSIVLAVYFFLVVIVISFFIINLFVGVVVSTYNKEKEMLGSGFLLTKE